MTRWNGVYKRVLQNISPITVAYADENAQNAQYNNTQKASALSCKARLSSTTTNE